MKQLICSICKEPIPTTSYGWSEGNNAQPINDGRCCDNCDATVVIPKRIEMLILTERQKQVVLANAQNKLSHTVISLHYLQY